MGRGYDGEGGWGRGDEGGEMVGEGDDGGDGGGGEMMGRGDLRGGEMPGTIQGGCSPDLMPGGRQENLHRQCCQRHKWAPYKPDADLPQPLQGCFETNIYLLSIYLPII